jgi:cytochrome c-type biogenesis protein
MDGLLLSFGTALWLGILTSISPCPLATNIAAIGFLGRKVEKPSLVLLGGLLYTLGRMVAYLGVTLVLVGTATSVPAISNFLQNHINKALGPILVITGLLLLEVIPWPWTGGSGLGNWFQQKADTIGIGGAALLGIVFAMAFCPVSAALFFGGLLPLALKYQSGLIMPLLYGIGTALPVVAFAVILGFTANRLSQVFNALSAVEYWVRRGTAVLLILIGVYLGLVHLAGLNI